MALPFLTMLNWFNGLRTAMEKLQFLPMQIFQSIGATHTLTQDYLRDQEVSKHILLGYEIETSIRDSFIYV